MDSLSILSVITTIGVVVVLYLVFVDWNNLNHKLASKYGVIKRKKEELVVKINLLKKSKDISHRNIDILEDFLFLIDKNSILSQNKKRQAIDKLLEYHFEIQKDGNIKLSEILHDVISILKFRDRIALLNKSSHLPSMISEEAFMKVNDIEEELAGTNLKDK